jgi:hypothetical protein
MTMIELTPTYDNFGGIRTEGGPFELYFSTIPNLKARLWRAQIDPARYHAELLELRRGNRTRLAVSSLQLRAFYGK